VTRDVDCAVGRLGTLSRRAALGPPDDSTADGANVHGGPRRSPIRSLVLGVIVTAVAIAGCTDDDPKAGPDKTEKTTTTKPESTTTADPNEAIKREIVEAYDRLQKTERKLFEAPDPSSPLVDEMYAAPFSETVRQNLATSKAKGLRSPPRPDDVSAWAVLKIEIRSPSEVLVSDCYLNGGWTLDASGQVVDDAVHTYEGTVLFVKGDDDRWRAGELEVKSKMEGRVGCAEQLP